MFEDQYVELLPARTTMKSPRWKKRGGSASYTGGAGGAGGDGGDGGTNVAVVVNPQISVFGDNTSKTFIYQDASGGNGGAGGAGGDAG